VSPSLATRQIVAAALLMLGSLARAFHVAVVKRMLVRWMLGRRQAIGTTLNLAKSAAPYPAEQTAGEMRQSLPIGQSVWPSHLKNLSVDLNLLRDC
jgi:hypothetical protein